MTLLQRLVYGGLACAGLLALLSLRRKRTKRTTRTRASSIGSTRFMVSGTTDPLHGYDTMITIRVGFETFVDVAELKRVFRERILPYRNFSCVPTQQKVLGEVIWQPVLYDETRHFVIHSVTNTEDLQQLVDKLMNATTDFRRRTDTPWWDVHLFSVTDEDGWEGGVRRMLIRVHHALGDGISLSQCFAEVLTDEAGQPMSREGLFSPRRGAPRAESSALVALLALPIRAFRGLLAAVEVAGWTTGASDSPTPFHDAARSGWTNKVAVYLPSHSLALVKKIQERLTATSAAPVTINDIEYALVAGMVRRYLAARGSVGLLSQCQIRSLTPVAVPEPVDEATRHVTLLRNHWTFVANDLPVTAPSPRDRVEAARATWTRIKSGAIVPAAFALHKLGGLFLGISGQRDTTARLFARFSLVFSNVPGPAQPIKLAGSRIQCVHMLFANNPAQVGLFSCAGYVHVALVMNSDPAGPEATAARRRLLAASFVDELTELAVAVGLDGAAVQQGIKRLT